MQAGQLASDAETAWGIGAGARREADPGHALSGCRRGVRRPAQRGASECGPSRRSPRVAVDPHRVAAIPRSSTQIGVRLGAGVVLCHSRSKLHPPQGRHAESRLGSARLGRVRGEAQRAPGKRHHRLPADLMRWRADEVLAAGEEHVGWGASSCGSRTASAAGASIARARVRGRSHALPVRPWGDCTAGFGSRRKLGFGALSPSFFRGVFPRCGHGRPLFAAHLPSGIAVLKDSLPHTLIPAARLVGVQAMRGQFRSRFISLPPQGSDQTKTDNPWDLGGFP